MNVLDLFSGIGGFSLGLERAGFKTIAFCEIDPFCRKVLNKHWPDVPIYEDIRELDGNEITADVITGGYPCQPFSQAGKRRGEEDDRHLWPEMYRLIKIVRPRWVIAENVAGHISMGLDTVLSDLEAEDYTCWTFVIPACAIDAKHRRDRVWIVGYSKNMQRNGEHDNATESKRQISKFRAASSEKVISNTANNGSHRKKRDEAEQGGNQSIDRLFIGRNTWATEPNVGRVAHGVSNRVDRLKSLGNAAIPQIPEIIGRAIMECENDR